jgi:hypothetical protein
MCPACLGSTFLLLSGAGSAGGLALIASRALRNRLRAARAEECEKPQLQVDRGLQANDGEAIGLSPASRVRD